VGKNTQFGGEMKEKVRSGVPWVGIRHDTGRGWRLGRSGSGEWQGRC
jgi:hypothetical protein